MGGVWVESGVIGAETAENLCWGFGCREEGFFAKVSSKYTLHFKYQAVLHYLHIRSQQRTADHYGISRTHLRRWIRAYQEGGIGALEHPQSKTMPQHRKKPFIADKPDQEKTQAELIEELCYMRAEVAYLKELKALSQKQTAKDKAKPSKH